jgi:tetratricopeptide (TPR) repeat protein
MPLSANEPRCTRLWAKKLGCLGVIGALAGTLLIAAPNVSSGQSLKQADALSKKIEELYTAGRYAEATPLAQRVLSIREKVLGADHSDVAVSLKRLADLYYEQGRYADAIPLAERSKKRLAHSTLAWPLPLTIWDCCMSFRIAMPMPRRSTSVH